MSNAPTSNNNFAKALRLVRKSKRLCQEDFSLISSRTYVSDLERNVKFPTLTKVDAVAAVLGVHPLTLLTISYLPTLSEDATKLVLEFVPNEISTIDSVTTKWHRNLRMRGHSLPVQS